MVAIAESFWSQWERSREKRELLELEQLAAWLVTLYGLSKSTSSEAESSS